MSNKETIIEWVRQLPERLGVPEIVAALQQRCAGTAQRAEGVEDYEWPAPDLTEEEWRQFVAHGLRRELEDPREDIYGTDDGVPQHGQG